MEKSKAHRYLITTGIALGLTFAGIVKAQQPPNPGTPPTPPPSPVEVFNKINPFKKNKKAAPVPPPIANDKKAPKVAPVEKADGPGTPPPPPNPLDLFKKNKKADSKPPVPPTR